jgi:hypothetical protein
MNMQMIDGLPGLPISIDHGAETADALFLF